MSDSLSHLVTAMGRPMLLSSHWRSEMIAAQVLIANLSPFVGSLKCGAGGAILLNSLFAINYQLVCRTV
ncbi:hypothetical protein P5Z58_06275, partial [Limosilactobacillus mucosae]|nr:hypothetical protein [Limosilactobacillus mucosae]